MFSRIPSSALSFSLLVSWFILILALRIRMELQIWFWRNGVRFSPFVACGLLSSHSIIISWVNAASCLSTRFKFLFFVESLHPFFLSVALIRSV
jgi:hypothetical protein